MDFKTKSIIQQKPLLKLFLPNNETQYVEMTKDDAKIILKEKKRFQLVNGDFINSSLVIRVQDADGVDYIRVYILDKMNMQSRRDFLELERIFAKNNIRPTIELVEYHMKKLKEEREYYQTKPLSKEEKEKRKQMSEELVRRMNKFFNK